MTTRRPRTLSTASAQGALWAVSPAPLALVGWWYGPDPAPPWAWAIAAIMALAFIYAGFALPRNHTHGRIAASIGLVGIFPAAGASLLDSPALVLFLAVAAIFSLFAIDRTTDPGTSRLGKRLSNSRLHSLTARGAAFAALLVWVLSLLIGKRVDERLAGTIALGVTVVLPLALAGVWAVGAWRNHITRVSLLALGLVVAAIWLYWRIGPPATSSNPTTSIFNTAASLLVLLIFVLPGRRQDDGEGGFWDPVIYHPERLLVATFGLLCVVGTVLLALPVSSSNGLGVDIGDAAFTAVSSVCVTGLAVLDTSPGRRR